MKVTCKVCLFTDRNFWLVSFQNFISFKDELPPPPPMDMPPQLTLADNDYHLSHPNEEELPPPPSPVSSSYSSSYSELRRATAMPSYPSQNYQHLNNANVHGHHGNVGRNDSMQTYANSYQPDYGSQVIVLVQSYFMVGSIDGWSESVNWFSSNEKIIFDIYF